MDRDGNRSNPYRPDPAKCCERCAFGRGEHASWCSRPPEIAPHVRVSDATLAALDELEGPVDVHRFDDDGGAHR